MARSRSRTWFNLLFPLSCFFVFAYPVWRLSDWWFGNGGIGLIGALLVWGLGVGSMYYSFGGPRMKIRYAVVHWMGISFVFATLVLLAEPIRLLGLVSEPSLALAVIVLGILLCIGAVIFSHHLSVKHHRIPSAKLTEPRRIVQISDVHIGSRQGGFMARIVNRINALEPDYVAITGDLIDSSAVGMEALAPLAELRAPVFFSIGNHERYADLPKMLDMARQLGMRTLQQDIEDVGDILFAGIDDADRHDQVDLHIPGLDLDHSKFIVLLYHRPVGWEAAQAHGVDLMLSGHTHNGQIFPFNFVVKQQFQRIRGLYRERHHHLHVSSGTGTWGPLMRLGSLNEITVLELEPERQ